MTKKVSNNLIEQLKELKVLSIAAREQDLKNTPLSAYKKQYTSTLKSLSIEISVLKNKGLSEEAKGFLIVNKSLKDIQKYMGLLIFTVIVAFLILIQVYISEMQSVLYLVTIIGVIVTFLLFRKLQQESKQLYDDLIKVEEVSKRLIHLLS